MPYNGKTISISTIWWDNLRKRVWLRGFIFHFMIVQQDSVILSSQTTSVISFSNKLSTHHSLRIYSSQRFNEVWNWFLNVKNMIVDLKIKLICGSALFDSKIIFGWSSNILCKALNRKELLISQGDRLFGSSCIMLHIMIV